MNTKTRIIKGHYDLELIVGNFYKIRYGIHQGVYKYLGQETKGFWKDASVFENIVNHNKFCYYGLNSPYEFTSIVHHIKESEVNEYIKWFKNRYPEDYV
jgi:hypothetical protein